MGFFRNLLSNDSSERDLRTLVLIRQNKLLDEIDDADKVKTILSKNNAFLDSFEEDELKKLRDLIDEKLGDKW